MLPGSESQLTQCAVRPEWGMQHCCGQVSLNVDGVGSGKGSVTVSILTEQFKPIPGSLPCFGRSWILISSSSMC